MSGKSISPEDILNSDAGKKINLKKNEIEQLAATSDGKRIQEMLNGREGELKAALDSGNILALKSALNDILKTDEGSRLAEKLSEIIK